MDMSTKTHTGLDKKARYGWVTKDAPGIQQMIHKDVLQINAAYQREVITQKVMEITQSWSWLGCGSLIVGKRNGEYWVIDGQHRVMAAKRRSDITHLPCVVFETEDVKHEAKGFLDANTGRKPVSAIDKQKALVTSGDEIASFVNNEIARNGLHISKTCTGQNQIKCISWCIKRANENKDNFSSVLSLAAEISAADNMFVPERILEGLWILNLKCDQGLSDKRLVKRIKEKGSRVLLEAANRAAAYYASGGGNIWAQGMLAELNKGVRIKFSMDSVD